MKVSILIPCYNASDWIKVCVDSALSQTIENKEVIVVDDGSTDESVDILKSYGDKITLEAGPNRGGNAARNRLLELARGEWVQFLDADDELLPEKIQNQLTISQNENDTDVVWSPITTRVHNGESWDDCILEPGLDHDIYSSWLNWDFCQTNGAIWKASSLKQIGAWNEEQPCCQDNELCLRALKNDLKIAYFPKAESIYRQWSNQTVSKKSRLTLTKHKTLLIESMLSWLDERKLLTEEHKELAGQAHFQLARYLAAEDLTAAIAYAKTHQNRGLFRIQGSAAPRNFALMSKYIGYANAERLAALLRK